MVYAKHCKCFNKKSVISIFSNFKINGQVVKLKEITLSVLFSGNSSHTDSYFEGKHVYIRK